MKTIIIVGGSKGIGHALLKLALESYRVINISRTKPDINQANLVHYNCDVTKDDLPIIDQADGLVYCPGSINLKPISRLSTDDFRADFEINVLGAVRCIQHYMPILKNGIDPSVILFSTVATKLGMPYHASIATAKAGVEGLVKSLGAEWAPSMRINAIAPTVTDTSLASRLLRNDNMRENITERHPLKKFLHPAEVAEMAMYLLSEKSRSISGQVFAMDCGIVNFKI